MHGAHGVGEPDGKKKIPGSMRPFVFYVHCWNLFIKPLADFICVVVYVVLVLFVLLVYLFCFNLFRLGRRAAIISLRRRGLRLVLRSLPRQVVRCLPQKSSPGMHLVMLLLLMLLASSRLCGEVQLVISPICWRAPRWRRPFVCFVLFLFGCRMFFNLFV